MNLSDRLILERGQCICAAARRRESVRVDGQRGLQGRSRPSAARRASALSVMLWKYCASMMFSRRREVWDQVKLLEDEADLLRAEAVQLCGLILETFVP